MMIRKSMISVVAATAIITGIVGCGSDDTTKSESNSTQTINNVASDSNRISNAKGTVTGTVMDTNGNPLKDVTVYLAGKTTKTDAGGVYVFNDVPVMNTVNNGNSNIAGNSLQVTIAAPTGFLGATVTVTPQAQQISSEDNNNGSIYLTSSDNSSDNSNDINTTNTTTNTTNNTTTNNNTTNTASGQANPNTNFIDGYIASAGTAVLPKLGAKVTGRLELANSEAPIANQEISLDFRTVGNAVGGNVAQTQNGVTTTYATNTGYAVMTDANGIFEFVHLPMDTQFAFVVPNYNIDGIQGTQGVSILDTTSETSLQNIGDLQVTAVVQSDSIQPFVVGVTGTIGNTVAPQTLEDDVRKRFVVNFSEPMNIETDADYTNSVIVKAGATKSTMSDVNATVTAGEDGKSVIVELDKELTDSTYLDINLLVTDFKDKAGNFLTIENTPIAYDSSVNNNQVVKLELKIFNDLNINAPQVKVITQMSTFDGYDNKFNNSAFNSVKSDTNISKIYQLNNTEAETRLEELGKKTNNIDITITTARVSFEPSQANKYKFELREADGTLVNVPNISLVDKSIGTLDLNHTLELDNKESTSTIELILENISIGSQFIITPVDELDYEGTKQALILHDNVEPTTVLQNAYGFGNKITGSGSIAGFGDGGELSNGATSGTAGIPYLPITAGLLDNLTSNGTSVTGTKVPSDNNLENELYVKSNATLKNLKIYDAKAYVDMNKKRTIGIAFSENIKLLENPSTTDFTTNLEGWSVNNNVTTNDDTNQTSEHDLINFTVTDVIALANDNNGKIIDFTNIIQDVLTIPENKEQGVIANIATAEAQAKVKIEDKMPPFVTKASFDGEYVNITFNEDIKLANDSIFTIEDDNKNEYNATYSAANFNTSSSTELKIKTNAFYTEGNTSKILTRKVFNIGDAYAESAYDNKARLHARLHWNNIKDINGNSWETTRTEANLTRYVDTPSFAIVDMIGDFIVTTDNSGFTIDSDTKATTQTILWKFNHTIDSNLTKDDLIAIVDGTEDTLVSPTLTLSTDKKELKFTFKTSTKATRKAEIRVDDNSTAVIKSAIDPEQKETVSATAN